jgi:hypothetical protein
MPVGLAQHPLPQSASVRHWPPINWPPAPLPTFLAPAGSNGGTADTEPARKTAKVLAVSHLNRIQYRLTGHKCGDGEGSHVWILMM